MASIVVSDYTTIVNKLDTLRATVSAAWSTVTTYGSGVKPSVTASNTITAKQINTLVEAYFDFKEKWIGSVTCSATLGNCTTYGTSCPATDSCPATAGNCMTYGSTCSVTSECSANCVHADCFSTCPSHTCGSNVSYSTVNSSKNGNYRANTGSSYSSRCESVYNGNGS